MEPAEPALPVLPDRFTGVELLGRGSQAITVAAYDAQLGRPVAIKVLELTRVRDWKALERFERECAVLESLDHPGVPTYLGHVRDEARGQSLLVLERIEGRTLAADLAAGRRRTEAQLLDVLSQLLDVLEYLHELHPPVIHRDIKPGNVIVRPDGRAVLVDFGGVAKVFQPGGAATVVGTFGYMAPEQLYGRVTPASDLYGLGATIAAVAAGEDAEALPRKGLEVDLSQVMSPGPLRHVLQLMLEADPERRPASVAELRARLREATDDRAAVDRAAADRATGDPTGGEMVTSSRRDRVVARRDDAGSSGVPGLWRRLSPTQRGVAIGYLWLAVGLGVATRAVVLTLGLVLLFPVVVGVIRSLGRKG